jgi:hypothetical protein
MTTTRFLPILTVAALAACTDGSPIGPVSTDIVPAASMGSPATEPVSVMTRNVYIGADVDVVIGAFITPDPTDDVPALLAGIAQLQATSFPHRADALVDEIERFRPHVVGLQEIATIDIDLTGFGIPIDFDLDYLPILQAVLAGRGLNYVPVAAVVGITATLPGVTVIDRDVILVDADRATWDPASVVSQTFAANLGMVAPGIELLRGWVSVDVTVGSQTIRVASTHLESGNQPGFPALRALQAAQLVASLGAASPAILMGDLNDPAGSPMYGVVTGAGFVDAWAAMRPGAQGLTCCHASDLSNRVAVHELDQRIDFIMTRGFGHRNGMLPGQIRLLGITPGERVAGPQYDIWPSDHAGIVLGLISPPGGS